MRAGEQGSRTGEEGTREPGGYESRGAREQGR